ncbi:MAG: RluA family pseudouridine synthase [Candidatus Sericytochromatia bacterium]|nr:RluA family pseudouridine synthase [Candidatus Sericytochromatia bacterium]
MTKHDDPNTLLTYSVAPDTIPQSLETYVASQMPGTDRLDVRQWVKDGRVMVDGQPGKASRYVTVGQQIAVTPPPPRLHEAVPQALDLPIRFQDEALIVVSKPTGMATHPGPGWWKGSCVNALLHAISDWPGVGGVAGPGIVHRLDRDTTGLLIFAKTDRAHQALLTAMRERQIERQYVAWVVGHLEEAGMIDAPLARDPEDPQRVCVREDGKNAVTHWRTLRVETDRTLLALRLGTGRNHQIRVHMASRGNPVWGDPVYGTAEAFMALHAWQLRFPHPITGIEMAFEEPVPPQWQALGAL